jgi:hypothetical protein
VGGGGSTTKTGVKGDMVGGSGFSGAAMAAVTEGASQLTVNNAARKRNEDSRMVMFDV